MVLLSRRRLCPVAASCKMFHRVTASGSPGGYWEEVRDLMLRVFCPTAWVARMAALCICVAVAVITGACSEETQDSSVMANGVSSPSSGCARTPSLRSRTVSLRHDGMDRSYDVVVPENGSGAPMSLVLGYHGFGGSPDDRTAGDGLRDRALRDGFVAVFPRGSDSNRSTLAYFNLDTVDDPSLADDVGFTEAILDDVEAALCIDRTRIYAMGMSNGGMFVSTLACTLGDRIAAVAPVAGVHLLPDCGRRPVPIIVTHGTSDPSVPFDDDDVGAVALPDLFRGIAISPAQLRMFEPAAETPVTSWVELWAIQQRVQPR